MKTDFDYSSYQQGERYGMHFGLYMGIIIGVVITLAAVCTFSVFC
ncbi:hypothetical protein [Flavimarina sp. Hel_I_48]|nr:hypothetical protein [Flavimarina sp. Hel_I_48]